jgi:hypothetical protein
MKHLKPYSSFPGNINEELDIDIDGELSKKTVQEISDIFIHVKDCGLEVADVYSGHALSMGDKDIVNDHREFSTILGPDGRYVGSYKSTSIRLRTVKSTNQNERPYFHIEEGLFDELESAVSHIESQLDIELGSIYLRTSGGVWFNSVNRMKQYIDELPFAKRESLKWVTYIDLTFKDEEEDINDSVSVKESVGVNELESIFDYVKDILKDLEDDHEIDVDIIIGQYRKMYIDDKIFAKSWKESNDSVLVNSINIDLKDNKYNFFRFNDHILPTINKLKSFLRDYDLNIDIELTNENEFYPVDEFIKEYGGEEFHELGIIIY